jgi:hypothetical protein
MNHFEKKIEVALFLSNYNYFYHRWAPLIILDLFIANPLTFLASSLTNNPFNFFTLASPLLGNLSFYHKNCREVNTLTSLTTSTNTSLLIFAYSSDMSGARQDKDLFFFVKRASFTGIEKVKKILTRFTPDFTIRGNYKKILWKAGLIRFKCCQNIFCSTVQCKARSIRKNKSHLAHLFPEILVVGRSEEV